jgi:hypothetical protein
VSLNTNLRWIILGSGSGDIDRRNSRGQPCSVSASTPLAKTGLGKKILVLAFLSRCSGWLVPERLGSWRRGCWPKKGQGEKGGKGSFEQKNGNDKKDKRAGRMTKVVECLPCKHVGPEIKPQYHTQKK